MYRFMHLWDALVQIVDALNDDVNIVILSLCVYVYVCAERWVIESQGLING